MLSQYNMNEGKVYIELSIAGMVSRSCIRLVQIYFQSVEGVEIRSVRLAQVSLDYDPQLVHPRQIEVHFERIGFKVMKEEENCLAHQIKAAAIELIHFSNNTNSLIKNSDYISQKVGLSYSKISRLFSDEFNTTLEKYIILLKIEKTKTMLLQKDYNLSEISYYMGYSSVQYLSRQFKSITGLTVSQFKKSATEADLVPLDQLV